MLVKVCASSGRSGAWRFARTFGTVPVLVLAAGLMAEPAQAKKRSAAAAYRPAFAAMAIDAYSGKTLYERSPDEPRYPASLTKMMTLYLVFQDLQAGKINRNSRFTVSAYAASRAPPSSASSPAPRSASRTRSWRW